MKKLVSILTIILATVPAFATDITGSSDCDNSTLGTYSAPVDMEAKWTANTINLQWYDDANDTTPVGTTCQYSSTISLPTEPTKPGYNFGGWQLRAPATFDLRTLASYINTDGNTYTSKSFAAGYCNYYTGNELTDILSETCSESVFIPLDDDEWRTEFTYGTVKGVVLCSATDGEYAMPGTPDASGEGDTKYCWCKATGFDNGNTGTFTNVSSSVWAFESENGSGCNGCVDLCGRSTYSDSNFRRAIYGITD